MTLRNEHLEKYAAAFIKQVGSEEASKYMLVESVSPNGQIRTWSFELTPPPRSEVPTALPVETVEIERVG